MGMDVFLGEPPAHIKQWIIDHYEPPRTELCFTAKEPDSSVSIVATGSAPKFNMQTSIDGTTWSRYTVGNVINLTNVGDKVYFKAIGSNDKMATSTTAYNKFVMTGKIAASGNVNSLLQEDEETARTMSLTSKNTYCFLSLFNGCNSLTTAPELPATTLANNCYDSMFTRCKSLTTAPELPATTLANNCYQYMF